MFINFCSDLIDGEEARILKEWTPIEKMSEYTYRAVIASEDNLFLCHNGFDWNAIEKAREYNKTHDKKRGASTITQQTAKNVFLYPSRTWIRKGLEAYFTVLIELFWSKERIIEVYLNVAEMGHGIYGIEAASKAYFNKSSHNINIDEASLIAAALPQPRKLNPGKPSPYMTKRMSQIKKLIKAMGTINLNANN